MSSEPSSKPRVSLSKADAQAGVGAELLSLYQSLTADGVLTNQEIVALHGWLATNRDSNLPAIAFLTTTVEQIVADR